MEYTVEYWSDKNIVGVKTKGRINFHIAETYSKEAIKLAREKGCTKFLIEHKEIPLMPGLTNIFATGGELQQFGFKNSDKIAFLTKRINKYEYSKESQIGNISWSKLKYFSLNKAEEALDWLSK